MKGWQAKLPRAREHTCGVPGAGGIMSRERERLQGGEWTQRLEQWQGQVLRASEAALGRERAMGRGLKLSWG